MQFSEKQKSFLLMKTMENIDFQEEMNLLSNKRRIKSSHTEI